METIAAVMTSKGPAAISNIQLAGPKAEKIIKKIFQPASPKHASLETPKICLGNIADGRNIIDQVIIGCEAKNNFAINCHGNPLIVEMIMELIQRNGAKLLSARQLLIKTLTGQNPTISIEAKLEQINAVTLEGSKIIHHQTKKGLAGTAEKWLEKIDTLSLAEIQSQAEIILKNSQIAKLIIRGCKIVIAGPPNSGKSTLLNCLSGREKSIVTETKGTTRDYVSANCRVKSLLIEFFDTAGLHEKLANKTSIDKAAQEKTIKLVHNCDLVLLVLDSSQTADQLDEPMLKKIADKKVLTVLNKSDLCAKLDESTLPSQLADFVKISAKKGMGIEQMVEKIRQTLGVADFDQRAAVCFSGRQHQLIRQILTAKSKPQAASLITELLKGQITV